MRNRIINVVIWLLLLVIVAAVVWFVVSPLTKWSDKSDIHFYARLFLVLTAVNTFAVLRLYNSIVQNTRFLIKLRDAISKLNSVVPNVERTIKGGVNPIINLRSSVESLKSTLGTVSDKIENVLKKK